MSAGQQKHILQVCDGIGNKKKVVILGTGWSGENFHMEVEGAQNMRNIVLKCFERASLPNLSQDDQKQNLHFTVMFECSTAVNKSKSIFEIVTHPTSLYIMKQFEVVNNCYPMWIGCSKIFPYHPDLNSLKANASMSAGQEKHILQVCDGIGNMKKVVILGTGWSGENFHMVHDENMLLVISFAKL